MKPKEKKPEIVYRIIDRESGRAQGVSLGGIYGREHYDFDSAEDARGAGSRDTYWDKRKYKIAKYRVTHELLEDAVDGVDDTPYPPPTPLEAAFDRAFSRAAKAWNKKMLNNIRRAKAKKEDKQ